jgi:hypothetical protein
LANISIETFMANDFGGGARVLTAGCGIYVKAAKPLIVINPEDGS